MSENSKIEWCDATWNPVAGCSKISQGCRGCYAIRQAHRMAGNPNPKIKARYEGLTHIVNGHPEWNGVTRLNPDTLGVPRVWRRPRRIFVNSLSDLFHETLTVQDAEAVFREMLSASQHTYMILTKRADIMAERIPIIMNRVFGYSWTAVPGFIQMGVSVEDQPTADRRIPHLLLAPLTARFVSYEPALAAVNFRRIEHRPGGSGGPAFIDALTGVSSTLCGSQRLPRLNQVIVGGESGPGARGFDLAWAQRTVDDCKASNVACFVKQLGAHPGEVAYPSGVTDKEAHRWMVEGWTRISTQTGEHWRKYYRLKDKKGGDMSEWPESLRVREFPEVRP